MNLTELVAREEPTDPWAGVYKIPWHEQSFSNRLLDEHLDQTHDAASRPFETVDKHVRWIHETVLEKRAVKVLDLCCGPGFYTSRLARLGHDCTGIDFAPTSIGYAQAEAADRELACNYIQDDVRTAEYGSGYGLAMLLFGEFNVFPGFEIQAILKRMHAALAPGGRLVIEPQRFDSIQRMGNELPHWHRAEAGLFCDGPHLYLEEHFWNDELRVTTQRYYVVNAETAEATEYVNSQQAYTHAEIAALLETAGFEAVEFHAALSDEPEVEDVELMAVCATKL